MRCNAVRKIRQVLIKRLLAVSFLPSTEQLALGFWFMLWRCSWRYLSCGRVKRPFEVLEFHAIADLYKGQEAVPRMGMVHQARGPVGFIRNHQSADYQVGKKYTWIMDNQWISVIGEVIHVEFESNQINQTLAVVASMPKNRWAKVKELVIVYPVVTNIAMEYLHFQEEIHLQRVHFPLLC